LNIARGLRVAALATIAGGSASAQDARITVTFRLRSAADSSAVVGASLTVDDSIALGYSDSTGTSHRISLMAGAHVVKVTRVGFRPLVERVEIRKETLSPVEFRMEALATALGTVVIGGKAVALRMTDFEHRRLHGLGTFFTREQLDSAAGRSVYDLFRAKGVGRFAFKGSATVLVSMRDSRVCEAQVLLNGSNMKSAVTDLNQLRIDELDAIEYYRDITDVPVQFRRGQANCGTLILWTRSR